MRSDSDLHEPRTNAEQSETGDDLRVSYESEDSRLWAEIIENYTPEPLVYFVRAQNGLVKIGFASDFDARLRQLVCMSPVPLQVLAWTKGARRLEGEYHQRFKASRRHGEWFEMSSELQAEIDRLIGLINAPLSPERQSQ